MDVTPAWVSASTFGASREEVLTPRWTRGTFSGRVIPTARPSFAEGRAAEQRRQARTSEAIGTLGAPSHHLVRPSCSELVWGSRPETRPLGHHTAFKKQHVFPGGGTELPQSRLPPALCFYVPRIADTPLAFSALLVQEVFKKLLSKKKKSAPGRRCSPKTHLLSDRGWVAGLRGDGATSPPLPRDQPFSPEPAVWGGCFPFSTTSPESVRVLDGSPSLASCRRDSSFILGLIPKLNLAALKSHLRVSPALFLSFSW